jgi:type VI secretion system protein ImpE
VANISAEQSLRDGNLVESLNALQAQVRADPSNTRLRVFLFQLLAVMGEWHRAMTQLNVVAELDSGALPMVHTYREALRCEVFRDEVFAGRRTPLIFGDPSPWMALLLEALKLTAANKYGQSQQMRLQAFEQAPARRGEIDGQSFEWLADADPRLGPVLEAIVNGRYYWVPFHNIQKILVDEPTDLRDIAWMPAQFIWMNGGEAVGLIPTRYPESHASDDPTICLARKTDWIAYEPDLYLGLGQRMLATDAGEYPIMSIRTVQFSVGKHNETDG